MNIPEAAVVAAAKILYADYASEYEYAPWDLADRSPFLDQAKRALDAAAPIIAAQALRDGASDFPDYGLPPTINGRGVIHTYWLKDRADELEADS